ncbi:MAG: YihA family ribosome biogenesis GTP-binding protein [Clostridia bacterium]|nr:YihA family ribosome biogenesis GTP-binding protein [Clostridia bacterium]
MKRLNLNNTKLTISAGRLDQVPSGGIPQVAFSGRSNVGKSSLLNALTQRKSLARVSGTPGKTITVNFYEIDGRLFLADLPGYGYAARSAKDQAVWSTLVDGYLSGGKDIKLVLQLIDLKVGPTKDDEMMLEWLVDSRMPFAVVATKADKLNKTKRTEALEKLQNHPLIPKGIPIIPFSALSGEGTDEIRSFIGKVTEI